MKQSKLKEELIKLYDTGKTKIHNDYISKDKIREKIELSEREYNLILNTIERKISHTKDEHKIRGYYAEFGVKKGRLEGLQELLEEE